MKIIPVTVVLLVLGSAGCRRDRAALILAGLSGSNDSSRTLPATETAVVERVFLVRDGKFYNIHYQITWNGQQAIVEDPIHSTNYKVGDKIAFLVMKHDMSSTKEPDAEKLLSFHALPYLPAPRP